jgi:hypothetical protein
MAFKEFIQSIKLLTSTKGEWNINKTNIVERVRNLLGEMHDDLFIKFKNIIGYNEWIISNYYLIFKLLNIN